MYGFNGKHGAVSLTCSQKIIAALWRR